MAITGLRWVQRADWSRGPTMIQGAPGLQVQMEGGPWWGVNTVYMNSAGQIRGGFRATAATSSPKKKTAKPTATKKAAKSASKKKSKG